MVKNVAGKVGRPARAKPGDALRASAEDRLEGLPERLQELAEVRAGSLTQLGLSLHTAPNKVYKWARGESQPTLQGMVELALVHKINLNWLLLGEGPMTRD